MKKNAIWIIAAAAVLIVLFGYGLTRSKGDGQKDKVREKPVTKVDAVIIRPSLLINQISVSGSLLAFEEVDLKNEVAGRVVKLNLPEGKFVKEGTLLVKLFDDDLQANLRKLQTQLAIQEQIYKRQTELLDVNGISKNDYEQTGLQVNSIKADIEVQKALIRKTEVLAPFDGVIGLRNISIGAQVVPSTLLATIRRVDRMKLDFSVPEKYGPLITQGMKVKFTLYNQDKPYDATVLATERGIDAATRNLKVRAVVDSHSASLLPGAYTNVQLRLSENPNAIVIPTQAIIPHEQGKSVIVARGGKAHFIDVETGIRQESDIEITKGIQPGDTVITTGILFLREGNPLNYSSITPQSL